MTVVDLLRRSAARRGTQPAVSFEGRTFTFADLDGGSNAAARVLRSHGLRPGDRICLAADKSFDFLLAYLGALKVGAVCVLINPAYRERELEWILADAEPSLAVADRSCLARVAHAAPAGLKALLAIERGAAPGTPSASEPPPAGAPVHPFYQELRKASFQPIDHWVEDPALALLLYTSGTTGRPKGALLTHGNLAANARMVVDAFRWTEDDRLVLALPLYHVHGLCVGFHGTLASGGSALLLQEFDAAATLDVLERERATLFMGVPTMYARFLSVGSAVPAGALSSMRLFVSGSAPLPETVWRGFKERFGHEILERYGMTETLITLAQRSDAPRRPGAVGFPLAGVETRIENGVLLVRGACVGPGYWKNDAATREAHADGWFRTGDLVEKDADGQFRIVGRAKELIVSGGFNVAPREVEEVLLEHPAVEEAAVFGIPDADLGEAVAAAIVAKRGTVPAPAELTAFCRERLAPYKAPRAIRLLDALPKNAMGKVVKADLQQLAFAVERERQM